MRKVISIILLAAVLTTALALTACNGGNVSGGEDNTPVYTDVPLTVCSFNIRLSVASNAQANDNDNWNLRRDEVYKQLDAIDADLYGFQEVMLKQRNNLKEHLSGYTHVGLDREQGREDGLLESCSLFFRTSRFELKDSGTFWLSETPDKISYGWDAEYRRVCTYVVLFDKLTGKDLAYFNTHLDVYGSEARLKGMQLIESKIDEIGLPSILTGDFNSYTSSEAYVEASENMLDTCTNATTSTSKRTYNGWGKSNEVIDYCFVTKDDFVINTYAVSEWTFPDPNAEEGTTPATFYSSDHNAVYATLNFASFAEQN